MIIVWRIIGTIVYVIVFAILLSPWVILALVLLVFAGKSLLFAGKSLWKRLKSRRTVADAEQPTVQPKPKRGGRVRDEWVINTLKWLAEECWLYQTDPSNPGLFVVRPEKLPVPQDEGSCADFLFALYEHTRYWVPGLTPPLEPPTVSYADLGRNVQGQYWVDESGHMHVALSATISEPSHVARILCHEACHHILDTSDLAVMFSDDKEEIADLAMFVCGFGEVFLAGFSRTEGNSGSVGRLGYLGRTQLEMAHEWVLTARGIRQSGDTNRFPQSSMPSLPRETEHLRKKLLSLLWGDGEVCDALIEYERRTMPHASEAELLICAIARLVRDRSR